MLRYPAPSLGTVGSVVLGLLAAAFTAGAALAQAPDRSSVAAAPASAEASERAPANEPRRRARNRNSSSDSAASNLAATGATIGAAPVSASDEPQTVCRNMRIIGSRVKQRVCATPEQWAASRDSGRKGADEFMRQMRETAAIAPSSSGSGPPPPAGPLR